MCNYARGAGWLLESCGTPSSVDGLMRGKEAIAGGEGLQEELGRDTCRYGGV